MKIDFHIHTKYSWCSKIEPEQAVKIAEKKGLDVIALINHNIKPIHFKGSKKVQVMHGIEVSTREGHVLIINTNKEYPIHASAQEVIKKAEKTALIIIPHAFDVTRTGIGEKIKKLKGYHALELNARCLLDKHNRKAQAYAKENNIPLVAGSDAHFNNEIGNAYTQVKAKTITQAIQEIKKGHTTCYLKKRNILIKLKPFIKSMINIKKTKEKSFKASINNSNKVTRR